MVDNLHLAFCRYEAHTHTQDQEHISACKPVNLAEFSAPHTCSSPGTFQSRCTTQPTLWRHTHVPTTKRTAPNANSEHHYSSVQEYQTVSQVYINFPVFRTRQLLHPFITTALVNWFPDFLWKPYVHHRTHKSTTLPSF